ncbi:DsbA family protein, partial [Myxococcota bacterium]
AKIDLEGLAPVGEESSSVTAVMYACGRCPFCARLTPQIHEAVTKGQLKGKVKLYFKLFPIRGHEHSKESGMAFLAANELGKFWEFVLYAYAHFDTFAPDEQILWAEQIGLDTVRFQELAKSPAIRAKLVASKKEGLANKVEATPTFFIDGHKYDGELNVSELVDVLEEAFERARGQTHVR